MNANLTGRSALKEGVYMSYRLSVQILWCVVLLVSLSMAGCLGSREWTYPPFPSQAYLNTKAVEAHPVRLVVFPLEDQRGMTVQEDTWKAAIPLVWQVVTAYDRPETVPDPEHVDKLIFDPPHDFARAVVAEIRNANIFSSVTFLDGAQQVSSDDFVLRGRLRSTRWERKLSTYLLGPFGPLVWMAGFPMGTVTTSVLMDLELTSAEDPSRVLWDFAMEFEGQVWDGVYYGLEDAVMHYPQAVQEALRPALPALIGVMSANAQR